MFRPRIIPCLLLKDKGLVKTVQFKDPRYIGDPINAVRIFNDREADELIFLDILASGRAGISSSQGESSIAFELIAKISRECMMPLSYGGGIATIDDITRLFTIGVEKVIINSQAVENPELVREAGETFGNQSIIVSIDARNHHDDSYEVISRGGTKPTGKDALGYAMEMEAAGAGELMITSIEKDGTMSGYDIPLIKIIADSVNIPVIAAGGAGKTEDLKRAYTEGHASAMAAGSLFVYHGRKKAVLINYPKRTELEAVFCDTGPPQ